MNLHSRNSSESYKIGKILNKNNLKLEISSRCTGPPPSPLPPWRVYATYFKAVGLSVSKQYKREKATQRNTLKTGTNSLKKHLNVVYM